MVKCPKCYAWLEHAGWIWDGDENKLKPLLKCPECGSRYFLKGRKLKEV